MKQDEFDFDELQPGPRASAVGIIHTNPLVLTTPRSTARPDARGGSGPLGLSPAPRALRSEWHEVSQREFLSWPDRKQYAYCAARDEVSASEEENEETAQWYLLRAQSYREMTV